MDLTPASIRLNEERFIQNIILTAWPTTYCVGHEEDTPWPLVAFDHLGFELGRFRSSRYSARRLTATLERLRKRGR